MARSAQGDREAFGTLVERHGGSVLRTLRLLTQEESAAEDAFQETFASAYAAAATYAEEAGPVRSWLFAIARNAVRRTHRRGREVPTEPALLELGVRAGWGSDDPERSLSRELRRGLLAQALASLTGEERELLLLRDVEGLSGEAAAGLLTLSLAAQKSRLHRARLHLMAAYRAKEAGVVAEERNVAGIWCSAVLERLSCYVDGELPEDERSAIDGHLRGCSVCERFGGRFAALVHDVRLELGAEPAVDFALVNKLRRTLAAT